MIGEPMNARALRQLLPALVTLIALTLAAPAHSQGSRVEIPLETYELLLGRGDLESTYSLGTTNVAVSVNGSTATARATMDVEVPDAEWTLIPVLPVGATANSVTVGGRQVRLVSTMQGQAWATRAAGAHQIVIEYSANVTESGTGRSIALPLPPGATTQLTATLPGDAIGAGVMPSTTSSVSTSGGSSTVTAVIPPSPGAQVSWQTTGGATGATASRATYQGAVEGDAIVWDAEFDVDAGGDASAVVPLIPSGVALISITVDGTEAPIMVSEGAFAVTVSGRGTHIVRARFQTRVDRSSGQPIAQVTIPRVPVSRFELTLDGQKEVDVTPAASVNNQLTDESTIAVVHVPMTSQVTFSWTEAVPETEAEEETRANAQVIHTAHAEEGVLYVRAISVFEVTRGDTSQFSLVVPLDAQINQVVSPSGMVADWRIADEEGERVLTVFLNQRVTGEFRFDVEYERLLAMEGDSSEQVLLPLLSATDVNRQRGMIALLASRELALTPETGDGSTMLLVGENQLPAFVRDGVEMTVAHTFRYQEVGSGLPVRATAPDRVQGRFDARVDTLVSLDDVTTRGASTVEIDVKSGSIMELQLVLPDGVNFLSLSAPSLRDYELVDGENGEQLVEVEFTQEMEGQFRIELAYERIIADGEGGVPVDLVSVNGAEVEQGRIAVEALTAVEVQSDTVENLSSVDIAELPQQLVLRTTNPILLAFKYVQAEPAPTLTLRVTRHQEVEVQTAVIDSAVYRTLYTRDGFTVTTASFIVRNSRQQFLRVRLPPGSEVWSAAVQGQPETPALATNAEDQPEVLVNIINSSEGFPVELIYSTPTASMAFMGRITGELPVPDMIVTESRWDLYLPDDLGYGVPVTDMDVLTQGQLVGEEELRDATRASGESDGLRISVPAAGVLFSFQKLYANQSDRGTAVSISYRSSRGEQVSNLLGLGGAFFVWLALVLAVRRRRGLALVVGGIGAFALGLTLFYFGGDPSGAARLFGALCLVALAWIAWQRGRVVVSSRLEGLLGGEEALVPLSQAEVVEGAPDPGDEDSGEPPP